MKSRQADPLRDAPQLIRSWASIWELADFSDTVQCEWSSRLTRSLGVAYPQRLLVRLNTALQQRRLRPLFDEVLCHEVAHVAVYQLHGPRARSHGPEWRALLQLAGYQPRRTYFIDELSIGRAREPVLYEHICPVCQARRLARRPQRRWRCCACVNAGLNGEMLIRSCPSTEGALDA